MSAIFQIQQVTNGEVKRMCVYSQRDFEYMVGKGWEPVAPPVPKPVAEVATNEAKDATPKKRGRPAKVNH